jgi:hypothetical protein
VDERTYIVSVGDAAPAALPRVAQQLRAAGVRITLELEAIGVIIGCADAAIVETLRSIPGVAAVEEQRTVDVSAPGDETE